MVTAVSRGGVERRQGARQSERSREAEEGQDAGRPGIRALRLREDVTHPQPRFELSRTRVPGARLWHHQEQVDGGNGQ